MSCRQHPTEGNSAPPSQADGPAYRAMNRIATLMAAAVILASCVVTYAQSGPFVFAYGLQGDGAAEVAAAVGLNTLYLEVPPRYDSVLPDIRSQIVEAGRAGLQVIVALPTVPPGPVAIAVDDPDNAAYAAKVVAEVVAPLKDAPALAGWAVGDYVEDKLHYTDTGLVRYLQQHYGRLEALNAAWGTAFGAWAQITITQAITLDDEQPFGVGRPSIDLADYQREAFAGVLELWARQVRSTDADTPLFTGRIGLYRCLTAVPDSYDFVVPAIAPDELEFDKLAHNVHAIDIARQAGRFQVVRALRVPVPGELIYTKDALQRWINQAALHGAAGIGLDNYDRLVASGLLPVPDEQRSPATLADSKLAEIVRPALRRHIFTVTPKPAAAFLYEPYAEGQQVGDVPVYGYISDFSKGEPDYLFNTFRCGSRFGLTDYLTVATLEDPKVDLQQYSFIAAPLALDLPPEAVTRLYEYVRDGGAIVADLGAGLRQSGSWQRLPSELQLLFGIEQMPLLQEEVGDFSFGARSPYFPSLLPPLQSQGNFRLSEHQKQGTPAQRRAYTFGGPVAHVVLAPGTVPWGVGSRLPGEDSGHIYSGIMLNEYGLGLALFATTRLWANWLVTDPVFQAFHNDLWARRAAYELHQPGLFIGDVEVCGSGDSCYLLNTGRYTTLVEFSALQADDRLYAGGFCRFSAYDRLPSGRRTGRVVVAMPVPPLHLTSAVARPIIVKPYHDDASAVLLKYQPDLVELEIAGAGAGLRGSRSTGWQLGNGASTPVRVTVETGLYPVAALSRHQVEIDYDFQPTRRQVLQADHSGRLRIDISGRRARVRIAPAD